MSSRRAPLAPLLLVLVLGACLSEQPPSQSPARPPETATPAASPTPIPTPTPIPEVEVPLAVVTNYADARASVTLAEVEEAAEEDLLIPCEVTEYLGRTLDPDRSCTRAKRALARVRAGGHPDATRLMLLPSSLITPDVKVLPVDGADLFGGPEARALPYPIMGRAIGVDPYDVSEIRTLMSLGDSCPDRGVAHAAITLGRGWDWVFNGGTAEYTAVYPNPVPPGFVGNGFNIVDAVRTGNEGALAELVRGADVTLDDFECPVVETFTVNDGTIFSIDPAVLPRLRDTYGVDVVSLASNHLFDRGVDGFLETLDQFSTAGLPITGAGPDIDAALEPATIEVNGVTFGFIGFNQIVGSTAAAPGVPGVAWLDEANIAAAGERARAVADVVICVPQWWGGDTVGEGAEYHATFRGDMREHQAQMFAAGCDHILGHGTHWSGPIEITADEDGEHRVTMVSHGNFLFGQEWSQQTQEGVLLELAFRGTELAQARMHPYIMLEQAQANLTDPETDGRYVLDRIYEASGLCCGAAP